MKLCGRLPYEHFTYHNKTSSLTEIIITIILTITLPLTKMMQVHRYRSAMLQTNGTVVGYQGHSSTVVGPIRVIIAVMLVGAVKVIIAVMLLEL